MAHHPSRVATLLPLLTAASAWAQCEPSWLPGTGIGVSPLNGSVEALTAWDPDGPGPQPALLVVSAHFPVPGQPSVTVGTFDGSQWRTLPAGFRIAPEAMAVHQGRLVVGGFSATSTGPVIASWDGTAWAALGSGLNGAVLALTVHNGDLFAAGEFTQAGGLPARGVARWDGQQWHALGSGIQGIALSLASFDGRLIAGGFMSAAGGVAVSHIAAWDGTAWSALGEGRPASVEALLPFAGGLVAAGAGPIARWDGTQWLPLGAGVNDVVRALTVIEGRLVAAGFFTEAQGQSAARIAAWDGAAWSPLGGGLGPTPGAAFVNALHVFAGSLAVGGSFDTAGGQPSFSFARWGCAPCYANCDGSTTPPSLNINDFICFQSNYAAGNPSANCDQSTTPPILNINDFVCFQTKYAADCP